MDTIYLDNAATTQLDSKVLEEMLPYLTTFYGNPSSIHGFGRKARAAIEKARKTLAQLLNCAPAELFFTSGATESNNTIIKSILDTNIINSISSPIEHHAVLHPLENAVSKGVKLNYLNVSDKGEIDLENLENQLVLQPNSFVSLMHINNEIGTITDIKEVGKLCMKYNSLFHSDTVQSIGLYDIDLQTINLDFMVGSAHKFHGPKGIGFMYVKNPSLLKPNLLGGMQERNRRAGTENVAGIVGLVKALEISISQMVKTKELMLELNTKLRNGILQILPTVRFNGGETSSKILSVTIPHSTSDDMILQNLDINNIAVSGGSACTSGSIIGSHVLNHLAPNEECTTLRFSLSRFTTEEEISKTLVQLQEILVKK